MNEETKWSVLTGLRIRIFNLFIKLLTCLLYVGRVIFDNDPTTATW